MPDLFLYLAIGFLIVECVSNIRTKAMECILELLLIIVIIGWLAMARSHIQPAVLESTATVCIVNECPVAVFDKESDPIFVNSHTNELVREDDTVERWNRKSDWSLGVYFVISKYPIYKLAESRNPSL